MNDSFERELKLAPASEELLDRLAGLDRLGPFEVRSRRQELQRNAFFDTPARTLAAAHIGFRRRTVEGESLAKWSLKTRASKSRQLGGVATRIEIELQLGADLPPAMALEMLRSSALSRGAPLLAEAVAEAVRTGGSPAREPFLESETNRLAVDLEAPTHGWLIEMALDRVQLIGHAYGELEIEAELKRGDELALAAARAAIEELGEVRESAGSKLSRAAAHLRRCQC